MEQIFRGSRSALIVHQCCYDWKTKSCVFFFFFFLEGPGGFPSVSDLLDSLYTINIYTWLIKYGIEVRNEEMRKASVCNCAHGHTHTQEHTPKHSGGSPCRPSLPSLTLLCILCLLPNFFPLSFIYLFSFPLSLSSSVSLCLSCLPPPPPLSGLIAAGQEEKVTVSGGKDVWLLTSRTTLRTHTQ